MKNNVEIRLGIFVALALVALFLVLETIGGLSFFKKSVRVQALFNNVQELKEGDPVKMAGVEIGKVEEIALGQNKVRVKMRLDEKKSTGVKTDSTATVKFAGLLGQNFVAIDFGSGAAVAKDGSTILTSTEQPDLSTIMQKMDNVASGIENITKSFTGDKIENLLGPFTDFLKANRESLTATFSNMKTISDQISRGEGTVGKLIFQDTLYNSTLASVTNLEATAGEIRVAVTDARKIVNQINSGEGTIGKLVKDETLYRETTASVVNLREILEKVNRGQGSVGKLINDQEFYKNAKLTLQKLDKATEGLEDQGPLSVLGIAVNSLF
jgi:phospholipid/cholesterol/gamma-HCH transport system substrate-binding protein